MLYVICVHFVAYKMENIEENRKGVVKLLPDRKDYL